MYRSTFRLDNTTDGPVTVFVVIARACDKVSQGANPDAVADDLYETLRANGMLADVLPRENVCVRCNGVDSHDCYHCLGTGTVSDEVALADLQKGLIEELARELIQKEIRARNENPDGENWRFCAAENMMSVSDYTKTAIWDKSVNLTRRVEAAERVPGANTQWDTIEALRALLGYSPASIVNDPKTPTDEDPRADEPMPGLSPLSAAVDSLLDREIDLMAADEGDDIPF